MERHNAVCDSVRRFVSISLRLVSTRKSFHEPRRRGHLSVRWTGRNSYDAPASTNKIHTHIYPDLACFLFSRDSSIHHNCASTPCHTRLQKIVVRSKTRTGDTREKRLVTVWLLDFHRLEERSRSPVEFGSIRVIEF